MNERTVAALIDEVVADHRRSTARLRERLRRDAQRNADRRDRVHGPRGDDISTSRPGIDPILRPVREKGPTEHGATENGTPESDPRPAQRPARWLS